MTFIDLFAGIGGARLGMERAGHKCIGFCEYDKYATASYTSMHLITDEQRRYLETLDLKQRQKEILKEEYRNGEWYAADIRDVNAGNVPKADVWCFGCPCQDFSVAGNRAGLQGERSSLIFEVFRILKEIREEDRPRWLIYENVKGMLSSNRGFDYLAILLEMDSLGYDIQWDILNTKDFGPPQNRERVYTVGHSRRYGPAEVFPLEGADREDSVEIKQIGHIRGSHRENPNQYRVYDSKGVAPTLSDMQGGGREPHITKGFPDILDPKYRGHEGGFVRTYEEVCPTISARDYKEPLMHPVSLNYRDGISGGVRSSTQPTGKGLQRNMSAEHNVCFGIDKSEHGQERTIANTITAREDRGVSSQNQTGTAVCIRIGDINDRSFGDD